MTNDGTNPRADREDGGALPERERGDQEAADRFDADVGEFICECGDPTCTEHIALPLEKYDTVRRDATRFVVRPGHVKGPVERIVKRERNHAVIEKVDRVVSRIARRLNPRPETI